MKNTRKIQLLCWVLLASSSIAMAQTKITHIAVYVQELDRSSKFYNQVLGFEEIDEPFKDGLHAWFNIGNSVALHLIEAQWEPITINKINHLCFSVESMDEFISNLNDQKVEFEDWPGNKNQINIRPDGIKQIYIRDPDGYWIEINDEY